MKWFVVFALLVALIHEGQGYGRGYRNRQRQTKVRPQTRPVQSRFDIVRRPQQYPIQPRIDISGSVSFSHASPDYDHKTYSGQSPSRGDIGGQSSHIVDLSRNPDPKQIHQTSVVNVPPIVRTIDLPKPHDETNAHRNYAPSYGDSDRHGGSDYDSELQVETTGYTTVFNVNALQGGTCKPHELWRVDCNKEIEHRAITAIWDDYDNFKDLDKVKCGILAESATLDLHDVKVIDFDGYEQKCDPDYVLTAVFDKLTGFPSISNGKCTRVAKGKLDNTKHIIQNTDSNAGGPSAPLAHWKMQCPYTAAAVGIQKEKGRIVALICAHLSKYNAYDEHVTIKRH